MLRIASTKALSSALTLLAFISVSLTEVQAQAVFNSAQAAQTGRFIEAPRTAKQQLREAEAALEEDRFSDAVVRLGDLLAGDSEQLADEDLAGQDFFLEVDDSRQVGKPVTNSMLRRARDRIGSLPTQALETYRLRYGPLARKLLDEAAQTRNWYQVRDVRRRYFHTHAGYDASALLAQHELYSGHALAASLLLDDIVKSPSAVKHLGPGIVMLHAAACRHASRDLPSIDSIGGQQIVVGDESLLPPSADELQEWLIRRTGETKTLSLGNANDYPIFGTSPDRNGDASGQLPLTNKRWDLVTTASPRQERDVREAADALMASGKLPPPSWFPIRIGNHLLMRTTERLVGIDYRTGKRVWTYPWQTASEELDQDEQSLDTLEDDQALGDLLRQRVWNDNPYGQITSDGERVFMLDSLGKVELTPFGSLNMRGTRPADGRSNTLVALDLATEGKLLWRLGAGIDDGTELSDAFFLGPPLPLDGRLYVIAELAGDISLFCLNPATGTEIWRQQLVAVESGGIETDAVRRVGGAVPTYDNGIMICPTGAGAIVAMDLSDRMIRWGVSYSRNVGINRAMIARGRTMDLGQLMQRWHSGTAVVSENTVLVTPIESDRLLGLDLLTGVSRFPQQNRINMRYLAGARDGRFFVVGPSQMRAFHLQEKGRELWNSPRDMLASGQYISGLGVFGEGEYLLPTSTNEIIRVSLEDGTVLGRRRTRYSLGNLVAVGGEIISQGPTKLSVAFGEQSLEPLVDRMLEQHPNDLEALIRKSELLIERGDRAEALQLLGRAREMDEENDEIRMLSVSAMLGQLRDDPTSNSDLIEQLDAQIDRPAQRVEYLSLLVRSALQRKDFKQAIDRLIDLSSLLQANPLLEPSVKEISDESGRHSSLDDWIAARISDIFNDSSEADRVVINEQLAEFANIKRHGTTSYLEHMVRLFGPWSGAAPMRQELEQRLRDDGAFLKLERLALGTKSPSERALSSVDPDRLLSLASAYVDGQLTKDALAVLDQLDRHDGPFDKDRAAEIRQAAEANISEFSWPQGAQLNWGSGQSSIRSIAYRQRTSPTKIQAGQQFEGWMLVGDPASAIAMRDPMGLVRRVPAERILARNNADKQAQICGGFMAVMTTSGLTGIDLFRLLSGEGDAILWTRSFDGQTGSLAKRRHETTPFDDRVIRYYLTSGGADQNPPELKLGPIVGDRLILLQGGELLAIDLLTSTTLWRNSNAPENGVIVSDGQRVAVVSSSSVSKRVDFFDVMDGRKVGTEKWLHGDIWAATETNVLAYQGGSNQPTTVKLVNPFDNKVLLEHQSVGANRKQVDAPCAYGRVVADRYMALLGSDGSTVVWDLREGREISSAKVTPYADLQGLQAMLLKDQIVLMPRRRQSRSRKPDAQQVQTRSGENHQTVDGVYAISLSDGSVRWHHDFEKSWGCTVTQPTETPLLMFSRSYATYTVRSRRKSIEVLALDVRDGNELHPAKLKAVKDNINELETNLLIQAARSRVVATIGPEMLTYTFAEPKQGKVPKE